MQTTKANKIPKIILGTVAAILIAVVAFGLPSSVWICWEVVSGAFVAVGCIGELYLFNNQPEKGSEDHHRLWELRYIFMVAVVVTMEFFALTHAIPEAASMERDVSEAKLFIAKIGTTNELLVQTNLALRSNVAILEAEVQWRTLNAKQKANLELLLKQLTANHNPQITVCMWTQDGDAEARSYGQSILDVCNRSGINGRFFVNGEMTLSHAVLPPGLSIGVCNPDKAPQNATLILKIFNGAGISVQGTSIKGVPHFTDDDVNILVGQKPPP